MESLIINTTPIIEFLNSAGGIPLTITTTTKVSWTQYLPSLLIGAFVLIWMLTTFAKEGMRSIASKISLRFMKRKGGRHIMIIKHTQGDLFNPSMINQETLKDVTLALNKFKGKSFDLILHTPGGDIFSAIFISRLFKKYPGKIRAIIPLYAMSGGTLLALSCDKLYMSDTACLGPVDPQLGSFFRFGSAKSWDKILKFKGKKAEDQSISFAHTGKQYTKSIRDHLINSIDFGLSKEDKKTLASFLTSGSVEHAHPLTKTDLQSFGMPIKNISNKKILEKLIKFVGRASNEGVTYV